MCLKNKPSLPPTSSGVWKWEGWIDALSLQPYLLQLSRSCPSHLPATTLGRLGPAPQLGSIAELSWPCWWRYGWASSKVVSMEEWSTVLICHVAAWARERWPPLMLRCLQQVGELTFPLVFLLYPLVCHVMLSGKMYSGGSGTSTQPHNLWPIVCSAYEMCWCKSGLEIDGVDNQWLVQAKTHATKVSPPRYYVKHQDPQTGWPRDLEENQTGLNGKQMSI